jgi:hypothetical protein
VPPRLDWQLEATELKTALSSAITDMGNQLLLLRPAVFKNPFDDAQRGSNQKMSSDSEIQKKKASRKIPATESGSKDIWQPYNPWSAAQDDSQSPSSKLVHAAVNESTPTHSPFLEEEAAAPVAQAESELASDKLLDSVHKRVVIATRELIAEKMRRLAPPQWLHPCISITGFMFRMCQLEEQQLRKDFFQSDIRLLLYTLYTRWTERRCCRDRCILLSGCFC